MGPFIYRFAFEPIADASVLALMMASVGVHFAMTGLGLAVFGAEGSRNPPYWDGSSGTGALTIQNETLLTLVASALIALSLSLFFARSMRGNRSTRLPQRSDQFKATDAWQPNVGDEKVEFAIAAIAQELLCG